MTTITVLITNKREYKRLICEGHSGYAESGEDIVCCAISVLVINTINALDQLTDNKIRVLEDPDKALIDVEFTEIPDDKGVLLMDSLMLGLKSIQEEYGRRFLTIKYREV